MEIVAILLIIAAAAIIFYQVLKRKPKTPVTYDKNFNDGYVETPKKRKKQERI